MNKGTLTLQRDREVLLALLREIPLDRLSRVLAATVAETHGSNMAELILLDASSKVESLLQ